MRLFIIYVMLMVSCIAAGAVDLPDEDLQYTILYKWGLINKQAGRATLSLRNDGVHYRAQLAAGTVPWADKVFKVRDTLQSVMVKKNCLPQLYVKIAHEGKTYTHDVIHYVRHGDEVTGDASRERRKKNGKLTESDTVLHATGPTVDMLSVFYYLRLLDFPTMHDGAIVRLNVFSGRDVEKLAVRYCGVEFVKIDGKPMKTYHLEFSFTSDGEPSDDMQTWISADDNRIPVKLVGKLPFGRVQAYYVSGAK